MPNKGLIRLFCRSGTHLHVHAVTSLNCYTPLIIDGSTNQWSPNQIAHSHIVEVALCLRSSTDSLVTTLHIPIPAL